MRRRLSVFLAAGLLAGLAGCETHPYHGDVRVHDRDVDVRVVFTDSDRRIIRDYFRGDYRALPPGLAKKASCRPDMRSTSVRISRFRRTWTGATCPPTWNTN